MRSLISSHPERENILQAELMRLIPKSNPAVLAPGWVLAPDLAGRPLALAFATQVMPMPYAVEATSVSQWSRTIGAWVCDALQDHAGPWRLQSFCHDIAGAQLRRSRLALIENGVRQFLAKKQRRLLRTHQPNNASWDAEEVLLQTAWISAEQGYVSVATPEMRHALRHMISPFAGGLPHIPEDKRPPARAYLKFCEAQAHLGRRCQHDETVVDLGASPGSWTFVALEQGARVTAIDRSALRDDLMAHPRLQFVSGDAFKYRPKKQVDWLLCDVIAFPERSIALLETWLSQGWCKHFVVTLKFRGDDSYDVVDACKKVLEAHAHTWGLRVLQHNKNEACAYGSLDPEV